MPSFNSNHSARKIAKRIALIGAALATLGLSGCAIVPYPPGFHRVQEVLVGPPRVIIEPGWRYAERPRHHHNHY